MALGVRLVYRISRQINVIVCVRIRLDITGCFRAGRSLHADIGRSYIHRLQDEVRTIGFLSHVDRDRLDIRKASCILRGLSPYASVVQICIGRIRFPRICLIRKLKVRSCTVVDHRRAACIQQYVKVYPLEGSSPSVGTNIDIIIAVYCLIVFQGIVQYHILGDRIDSGDHGQAVAVGSSFVYIPPVSIRIIVVCSLGPSSVIVDHDIFVEGNLCL